MPNFVTEEIIEQAHKEVIKKKGIELIGKILFKIISEGKCVQIMHNE